VGCVGAGLDLSVCTNPYDLDQRAIGGFIGAGNRRGDWGCGGRRDRRSIRWHRRRGDNSATATAILNGLRERHHHRVIGQRGPLGARYFDVADASHGLTTIGEVPGQLRREG